MRRIIVILFIILLLLPGCKRKPGEYDGMIVVNFREQFFQISHHGKKIELTSISVDDVIKIMLERLGGK